MPPSKLTLGRWGCLATSICMLSDYYKCFMLPSVAVGTAIRFTQDGLVIWTLLNFPCFKFVWRGYRYDQKAIEPALRHPDTSVVLQVNNGTHWVCGVRNLGFKRYLVYDPWGGKRRIVSSKEISGYATFTRK